MSAISKCKNAPAWLVDARTENANVEITQSGRVIWLGGDWLGGDWLGGNWLGGDWLGGDWLGGDWLGGNWHGGTWLGGNWYVGDWLGGTWRGGTWRGGIWLGGDWHGGTWHGGTWHGGTWHGLENRLDYMAAIIGIVFDADGVATAYRSTKADGHGRHVPAFVQPEGEYFEAGLPPAGSGTCVRGIHVSTAACAWSYFGVEPTAQLWSVRFKREDMLDCDGQKARIRGGFFERVPWPFLAKGGVA